MNALVVESRDEFEFRLLVTYTLHLEPPTEAGQISPTPGFFDSFEGHV